MQTDTTNSPPSVEALLNEAHRNRNSLYERRRMLGMRGIDLNHLPDDISLMAFALLGDHEREPLVAELRGEWPDLQTKGLVSGSINAMSTAELRLFIHALEHLETISSVWQQLRNADTAVEPPTVVWDSKRQLNGFWGQPLGLVFWAQNVSHLLIEHDPVFGIQPALMVLDPDLGHSGSFQVPIDNGLITVSLMHRSGDVYRLSISVHIEELS